MLNTKANLKTLTEINLPKFKLWTLEGDRRGDVISCKNGTIWITQKDDLKDYVLTSGQCFWVTKPGSVVVQALENAQFSTNLNELQNHIEINRQPFHQTHRSRIRTQLR